MAQVTEELIRNALRTVMDPELGQSLEDLGMVREVAVEGGRVSVGLVLTAPGCPLAGFIVLSARKALSRLPGVESLDVHLLDEPWEPPDAGDWRSWVDGALGR